MVKGITEKEDTEDFSKASEVFISYLDDDNVQTNAYVKLISCQGAFTTFSTANNIIKIPSSRVLKIKLRGAK